MPADGHAGRLLRFAIVGACGFVVDAGVLHGLIALRALDPYLARLPSFLAAATATWLLNRYWTFAERRGRALAVEWGRYLLTMLLGGAVNYAVYAALLATLTAVARWPALGVAAGSIAGMVVNYIGADRWIFRRRRQPGRTAGV